MLNFDSKNPEKQPNGSWFSEYKDYSEVPEKFQTLIKETMFENHYSADILSELTKCVRVMPHHQNTSGFFITVIEKIAECDGDKPVIADSDMPEQIKDLTI